ncbi:carbohydrate ABC transporter membrane protein 2 (CUT1 family) [Anaerobacterium chartisolvens]|uniref:Carbohydrate ABC transporter membrane protein 2 (CUT1 family) n=1 Tax=Anaerobacterium chartisolvens TaxID=1297424 RepID=A0A369AWM9_9FIRM|nr:carbohydrate ABC transporter permease [Anaerobacterium chartisolvens]RCX13523.1 carbohydrate ABC transporter membrane protein 2 (CUT1 family) [Anaerobacterium chartisolvens]
MNPKYIRLIKNTLKGITLFLICCGVIFPFLWMVAVSFRNKVDIFTPGNWFVVPTLKNYVEIINTNDIFVYFYNSIVVAVVTTLVSLVLGGLAAYGFARFEWTKREDRAFFALSQKFLPAMAVVIPYFLMASLFNLLDTRLVLIICYTTFNIPFTIWMMRGFIEELPKELEESAFIDGCTRTQTLFKIILPLVAPGLVATSIFCIINSWNEFVFANFLTTINSKTVPTSVMMYLSVSGVKWGEMAATGVLAVMPVLIFAVCVQKHMIRGLTFGAVKG